MTIEFWTEIEDRKTAHERILTGHGDDEMLPSDDALPKLAGNKKIQRVLDFGCGVGRNTYYYAKIYPEVHAYDFPNMTKMLKEDPRYDKNKRKIEIFNTWNTIKNNKYNVIFASLVFQHIDEEELRTYLKDMIKMSKKLIIFTRGYLDDNHKDIFPILEEYFDIKEKIADRESNSSASDEQHFKCILIPKK